MKKILIINSSNSKNLFLEKAIDYFSDKKYFSFLLLSKKGHLYYFFKKTNRKVVVFFVDFFEKKFFFCLSFLPLIIFNFFVIGYYKFFLKVDKIILINFFEKIVFTPAAIIFKIPVIWLEYPNSNYKKIKGLNKFFLKIFSKKVKIIVFSSLTKKELIKKSDFDKKNIELVLPGINVADFSYQENIFNNLAASRNYSEKNSFTFGFKADLKESRSLEIVLQATKISLEVIPDIRLIVFCKEQERKKIFSLIKSMGIENNVWIVNDLNIFKKWFKGLDVFVFNNNSINFFDMEMILGAQACSLPIVGREKILSDFVDNNKTGILIKHFSGEILAEEIIKIYKNIDLRNEIKKNCLPFVEKKFDFFEYLGSLKNILD